MCDGTIQKDKSIPRHDVVLRCPIMRTTGPLRSKGLDQSSGFQRGDPWAAASAFPGTLMATSVFGPRPDTLNQNLWGRGPSTCVLTSRPR